MIKKDIVKRVIRDFHVNFIPKGMQRNIQIPVNTGKIITLIGARRSGKTYILYQMIHRLADAVDKTDLVYINFEDERLNLKIEELDFILQCYRELYPDKNLSRCWFFFDEIQNTEGWEKFVRRVHDTISRHIFITGSNSKLLSSEIATALRGRSISYQVYPLSFREYLLFKNAETDLYAGKSRAAINNHLSVYLERGGFPEIINIEDELVRQKILQEYFNVMMFKDVVERYGVKNIPALKFFLKRLLSSSTKQASINNIFNELKSAGFRIGKNTVYGFMEAAENIFLAFPLRKHSFKAATMELGEKKIYAIDTGLLNAIIYKFSDDRGKAVEQAVFLELRRRGKEIFFYKDKTECDFIIQDGLDITGALQVAYAMEAEKTRQREIRGLLEACRRFGLKQGTIVTTGEAENINTDGIEINIIPLPEWLLSEHDCYHR